MSDLKYAVIHEYLDSETRAVAYDLVKPTYTYNDALKIAVSDNIENYFMSNIDYWPSAVVDTYRDTGFLIYSDYLDIYNSFFPLFSYKLNSSDIMYDLTDSIFGLGYHVVNLLDMPYQLTYLLDDTLKNDLKKPMKKAKKKATKRRKNIKGKGKEEEIDMNEIVYGGSCKSFAGGYEENELIEGGIEPDEIVGGGVEEFAGWGKKKTKKSKKTKEESDESDEESEETLNSCIDSCKTKFVEDDEKETSEEEGGEIEEVKSEMAGGLYDDGFY